VLSTIQARPAALVNPSQALKQADTLYGTFAYILADTLILDGHGRGEQRGAYDLYIVTHIEAPEVSPIVRRASFRRPVRYLEAGNVIRVEYSECREALCYIGSSPVRFDRVPGGALSYDFAGIGLWHYERVQPGAP